MKEKYVRADLLLDLFDASYKVLKEEIERGEDEKDRAAYGYLCCSTIVEHEPAYPVRRVGEDEYKALKALQLIHDLCIDYDGFNTVDGLKSLIDDVRVIAEENLEVKDRG